MGDEFVVRIGVIVVRVDRLEVFLGIGGFVGLFCLELF